MSQPGQSHVDTRGVVSWLLGGVRLALRCWYVVGIADTCSAPDQHLLSTCSVQSTARWRQRGQVGGARGTSGARGALSRGGVTTRAGSSVTARSLGLQCHAQESLLSELRRVGPLVHSHGGGLHPFLSAPHGGLRMPAEEARVPGGGHRGASMPPRGSEVSASS